MSAKVFTPGQEVRLEGGLFPPYRYLATTSKGRIVLEDRDGDIGTGFEVDCTPVVALPEHVPGEFYYNVYERFVSAKHLSAQSAARLAGPGVVGVVRYTLDRDSFTPAGEGA